MQQPGAKQSFLNIAGLWGIVVILALYMPVVSMAKNAMTALFLISGFWVLVMMVAGGFRDIRRWRIEGLFLVSFSVYLLVNMAVQESCANCLAETVNKGALLWVGMAVVLAAGIVTIRPQIVMAALSAGIILGSALLLVELYGNAPIYHWWRGGDVGAEFHLSRFNRQTSALVLIAWAPAAYYWSMSRRGIAAILLLVPALVAFSGESYAAQLSVICGFLGLGLAWISGATARYLVGGGAVALLLAAPILFSRTLEWGQGLYGSVSTSITHRLEIWDHAAARIADSPIWGWGFNQYRFTTVSPEELATYESFKSVPIHVHNNFLQIWVELGAIGALFALALIIISMRGIGRLSGGFQPFAWGLMAAVLSTASVAYGLWQHTWMAMIAMAVLCFQIARQEGDME